MYYKNCYPAQRSVSVPNVFEVMDQFLGRDFQQLIGADFVHQTPLVNIIETPENYQISVSAVGLQKEDFKIELEKNHLVISAAKESETLPEGHKFIRREYQYSKFKRAFRLSQNVDKEGISARYENGVLWVTVPKRVEAQTESKTTITIL